ncbi:MAG: tetratricopeptide repeat protein [Armatimonadota bacterium]|jgi:tetratricopeptide (TPR) repeat protein
MAETTVPWRAAFQHLQQGQVQEALALLQPAAAAEPQVFENRLYHGLALAQAGQLEAAVGELQAAAALNPTNAQAHYNLGAAYQGLRDNQSAAACYRRALEQQLDYPEAEQALAAVEAAAAGPPHPAPAAPPEAAPAAPAAPAAAGPPVVDQFGPPVAGAAAGPPPAAAPAPGPPAQAAPPATGPPPQAPPAAAGGPPAEAPAMPVPQPRAASGSGRLVGIIGLLVVLLGGGGSALWYFVLGGSAGAAVKETLKTFLVACEEDDFEALKEVVTSADQPAVQDHATRTYSGQMREVEMLHDLAKTFDGVEEKTSYTIGEIALEGDKATATVKLVDYPIFFCKKADKGTDVLHKYGDDAQIMLVREGGSWKVDMAACYDALLAEYQQAMPELYGPETGEGAAVPGAADLPTGAMGSF